jgi:hypothetical protein
LQVVLAGLAAITLACGGSDEAPSDSKSPKTTPVATSSAGSPAVTPQATGATGQVTDEPIALQTEDGVTLRGHFFSAPGPRQRVLLIASTVAQTTWRPYMNEFTTKGVAVLSLDIRGVGETGGSRADPRLASDIDLAVRYLKSREYPLVYIVGIGAPVSTAVFTVATNQELAGVGGLPAGGNASQEIARVMEPKLFMAEESDTQSVQNIDRLMAAAPGFKQKLVFQASGSLTDVLAIPTVKQAIFDFLAR